ncbi:MAG: hypothetical protein AUH96_03155 [Nitrospirae bacterium 13_2_20CM_2_61_4]|nr:MAG: hypothetical protein AUH96_03155 [Nitrospirae bacterium 13_2_20CM_2_61_4]
MALHGAGDPIASLEHPTVTGAVSERDDQLRIGRRAVRILQRFFHVDRHGARHHQCVGVPRGRGDVNPEPVRIVDRVHKRVHLHLASIAGPGVYLADGQRPAKGSRLPAGFL